MAARNNGKQGEATNVLRRIHTSQQTSSSAGNNGARNDRGKTNTPKHNGNRARYQTNRDPGKFQDLPRDSAEARENQAGNTGKPLTAGQLNLQRSRLATNNLLQVSTDRELDICFVQEPHTRTGTIIGLGAPLRTYYRAGGNPKTAICTGNPERRSRPGTADSTESPRTYRPIENKNHEFNDTMRQIEDTVNKLKQHGEVLLCVDANSKSPLWGSPIEDSRGASFHGMVDRTEMTVLNNGDTPTFDGPRGTSHIDITATTAGLYDKCSGWYILEAESMSDHRLIEFKIRESETGKAEHRDGFCNKKADWERFTEVFREQVEPLRAGISRRHDVDDLATTVNQAMHQACAASMPQRTSGASSAPRTRKSDPWGAAYRALRKKRPAIKLTCLRKEDNTYTHGVEETAELLLERFFPDDRIEEDEECHTAARREAITAEGGVNDIPITIPEKAIDAEPEAIVGQFNRCFETGTFPVVWKQALVKAIPKPGKEDMTELKIYRPICLLPMLGKVLDSILITRIEHWIMNSGGGYNDGQYGFTRGRSTVDAAEKVVETIRTAKETIARSSRWMRGCPANLLETMRSYLRDRTASIECPSRVISKQVSMGCPQGSRSGPGLWKVIHETIFEEELPSGCEVTLYADDSMLIARSPTYKGLKSQQKERTRRIVKKRNQPELEETTGTTGITLEGAQGAEQEAGTHPANLGISEYNAEGNDSTARNRIYTDGASSGRGAGAAFVLYVGDEEMTNQTFRAGTHSSAYQCELLATREALKYLQRNRGVLGRCAIINADCQAALKSMRNMRKPTELLGEIDRIRQDVMTHTQIEWNWVKSHTGVQGNERADELAKGAATNEDQPVVFNQMPVATVKQNLRDKMLEDWNARWRHAETGRTTAMFIPTVQTRRKMGPLDYETVQLVTGHGAFRAYLHRIGRADDGQCECGQEADDGNTRCSGATYWRKYGPEKQSTDSGMR
ncbi:hypothetical protein CBL_12329 [Carabus blaptoides fortunei]